MTGLSLIKNKHLVRTAGYLNGSFTNGVNASAAKFAVRSPATGEVLTELPRMTSADVQHGADVAHQAWGKWKTTTVNERSKVLAKMASLMNTYQDDLATIIALEAGKPFAEAKGEIAYASSFYDYYAEEAKRVTGDILQSNGIGVTKRMLVSKQPVGPAALITPWNFPSAMITRKVGPALAAGCTVLIKPAEQTPLSALALCAIAEEAGVPAGVVNCLTVAREEVVEVGTALCHSPLLRKVSFTGSTAVGKWLMRESAGTLKKISLELGGNAPFIVFDDADLEAALQGLLFAKFRNAGQACIASNRILVQSGVYDKFAQMVTEASRKLHCGTVHSGDSAPIAATAGVTPTLGPLIDQRAIDKVKAHVEDCVKKGGKVLTGGKPHEALNAKGGTFFEPTVITEVTRDMLPYKQETFGPLVPLVRFDTEQQAIDMANDTEFGLAAYAYTRDLGRAWRLSDQLEAGMVGVNEGSVGMSIAPFGGIKQSGLGSEGGPYGLQEYLVTKYTCMGHNYASPR